MVMITRKSGGVEGLGMEVPESESQIIRSTQNGLGVTANCVDCCRMSCQSLDEPTTVVHTERGREGGREGSRELILTEVQAKNNFTC